MNHTFGELNLFSGDGDDFRGILLARITLQTRSRDSMLISHLSSIARTPVYFSLYLLIIARTSVSHGFRDFPCSEYLAILSLKLGTCTRNSHLRLQDVA
jgi:hypothetical protein